MGKQRGQNNIENAGEHHDKAGDCPFVPIDLVRLVGPHGVRSHAEQ
jgi:hypothetical protein